ncbi:MAG: YunC family protein [Anaerolineae bacterium]
MWSIEIKSVKVASGSALGVRIGSPEKAGIIALIGEKGIIVCRNFDTAALEQRGVAAARVQGIKSIEEVLAAPIESCTAQARELGVTEGMKGADAFSRFL